MSPLDATNALFVMGFIVFVSSCQDRASQYGKEHNISVTRLRYSANNITLDSIKSSPIRAHLAFRNNELCKNKKILKGGALRRNNNVQYMENNVCFFTLNHINTLHYTKYTK